MAHSPRVRLPAKILGVGQVFVGAERSTLDLAARCLPDRDPEDLVRRTGIATRRWVEPGERAAELAARAVRVALERAGLPPTGLRRLIFVTSTGGDRLIPANANEVIALLGADGACDCFDLNNACMGFLTALDLAARSVCTGLGPVCVVVCETLSRFLTPTDPRPYLVLADAAVALLLGEDPSGDGGVLSVALANHGALRGSVTLEHPGLTGRPEHITFAASRDDLTALATEALGTMARRVLEDAGLTLEEVQWVCPHQPNGTMLERIISDLGVDPSRVVQVVREVGSVGAASIPLALERLWSQGRVRRGDRILMVGVGAGMASGAVLFQVAP
ncbi:MAG: 3-oxoacyl-ACP synthase III family protein [Deltaproteobacteria bacterium]|nr:3-oxoacyl-ACP synthase III family protein [Deltaproteobacteria bacterium]